MSGPLTAPCGKFKTRRGKPFDAHTLRAHKRDCALCNPDGHKPDPDDELGEEFDNFELAQLIAGDESDGVFFGIWNELGGW